VYREKHAGEVFWFGICKSLSLNVLSIHQKYQSDVWDGLRDEQERAIFTTYDQQSTNLTTLLATLIIIHTCN